MSTERFTARIRNVGGNSRMVTIPRVIRELMELKTGDMVDIVITKR